MDGNTYEKGILFHDIEFGHNDLLQLGRFKEAEIQRKRVLKAAIGEIAGGEGVVLIFTIPDTSDGRFYLDRHYRLDARWWLEHYIPSQNYTCSYPWCQDTGRTKCLAKSVLEG